jgi:predicted Fe-Mo cluster-binding NifX family protein
MLVAVASKSGIAIDEHFGHARAFRIYRLDENGCRFQESRDVDHYCHGQTGDQTAMQKILRTIADCQAVFVAKVGDGPVEKLAARGIEAVSDYPWEEIEPVLNAYFQKQGGAEEAAS